MNRTPDEPDSSEQEQFPVTEITDTQAVATRVRNRRPVMLIAAVIAALVAVLVVSGPEKHQRPAPAASTSTSDSTDSTLTMHQRHHGGMAMSVSSESSYLVEMIPHHEEAIRAARQLLAGTEREEMRTFARTIITVQQAEVATMRRWLDDHHPDADLTSEYMPMMRNYAGMQGAELDRAFLIDMIPHHMTAVMMSRQLINRDLAEHDDVVPFASTIAETQSAEMQQMHQWVSAWFGADAYPHMSGGMMHGATEPTPAAPTPSSR